MPDEKTRPDAPPPAGSSSPADRSAAIRRGRVESTADTVDNARTAYRALPGPIIDLIRDGVAPRALTGKGGGDVAVWNALVRTATSARQRGWSYQDWSYEIDSARSRLGSQARVRSGRKEKTSAAYADTLSSAWEAAEKWIRERPAAYTREDALAHVDTVRECVEDPDADLDEAERAIMIFACETAAKKGTDRPALARRAIMEATGLTDHRVRATGDRLHARGLLVLAVPGRSGSEASGRRRATLYKLPAAEARASLYQYRGTRSMGETAQVYGRSRSEGLGDPHRSMGDPDTASTDSTDSTTEGTTTTMPATEKPATPVTLTVTAADAAQLAEVLAALRSDEAVTINQDGGRRLRIVRDGDKSS